MLTGAGQDQGRLVFLVTTCFLMSGQFHERSPGTHQSSVHLGYRQEASRLDQLKYCLWSVPASTGCSSILSEAAVLLQDSTSLGCAFCQWFPGALLTLSMTCVQTPPSSASSIQPGIKASTSETPEPFGSAKPPLASIQDDIDGSHEGPQAAQDPSESAADESSSSGRGEQGPGPLQPPAACPGWGRNRLQGSRGVGRSPWHHASRLHRNRQRPLSSTRQLAGATSLHVMQTRHHCLRWGASARCQPCPTTVCTFV